MESLPSTGVQRETSKEVRGSRIWDGEKGGISMFHLPYSLRAPGFLGFHLGKPLLHARVALSDRDGRVAGPCSIITTSEVRL